MKKITFKIGLPKEGSVISLIKEVNSISCRIYLDLENGYITVENVTDTLFDTIIELVDKYYTIASVEIDNTIELADVEVINKPTVSGPQTEDDLIIQKVEFENAYVEKHINNLLKTAYWSLYNKRATEKEIGDYITTCMTEMSMRYSSKTPITFFLGDIIDVNYGIHLPGEIMGGHVHSIVCNIRNDNMAYVIPIIKLRSNISSLSYLSMNVPQDAIYNIKNYDSGIALIDQAKYVRVERFHSVIGKTQPEFFKKLLNMLPYAFDFRKHSIDDETPYKKVGSEEIALMETIGFALDKLDSTKKVDEQVETFLANIGIETTEKMVKQSFIIACNIAKINYNNIIFNLHKQFPQVKEEIIKNMLKEVFKNWLKKYPTLADKCPKISFISLLKIFAKKFA